MLWFRAMCLGSGLVYCNRGQPACHPCPASTPWEQPYTCKCAPKHGCACYRGAFPLCTASGWQCN